MGIVMMIATATPNIINIAQKVKTNINTGIAVRKLKNTAKSKIGLNIKYNRHF